MKMLCREPDIWELKLKTAIKGLGSQDPTPKSEGLGSQVPDPLVRSPARGCSDSLGQLYVSASAQAMTACLHVDLPGAPLHVSLTPGSTLLAPHGSTVHASAALHVHKSAGWTRHQPEDRVC